MDNKTTGFYDIVKLCKGGLSLNLPAFDASTPNRTIDIAWNIDKVRVPRVLALGVFVDGTLERMYKEGYFRIEPAAQFEKEVAEIFFPVEDKVEIVEDKIILEAFQKGNRTAIKKIIESGDVNKDKVIVLARENIDSISGSMVRDLEKILNVELVVENEYDGE